MKKLIFLFLITFSSELFPQTWDLLYKEDFLIYNETFESYGKMNCQNMIIKGDSTIVFRIDSDTLLMIYNHNLKKWYYKTKRDLLINNSIKDTLYKQFKDSRLYSFTIDSEDNIWLNFISNILKTNPDTIINFTQIYDKYFEKYYNILNYSQVSYDLKYDSNGDIYVLKQYYVQESDSVYYALCKYKNNRFESLIKRRIDRFYIDKLNRLWCCYYDSVFVYENEVLINQFSTNEFPEGYGELREVVFDSKNTMYALNENSILLVYDGETFKTEKYMYDIERYAGTHEDLSSCWLCSDSSDNIWLIGGKTCNLYKMDSSGSWSVISVSKFSTAADDWCYKYKIECAPNKKIWITAQHFNRYLLFYNYGFYIFNTDTTTSVSEPENFEILSLPDVWIRNLYPNPSNQSVTVDFFLERNVSNECKISLYNTLGMKVKDVTENIEYDSYNMKATITFSVNDLPAGAYIVVISAGNSNMTRLMLVGI